MAGAERTLERNDLLLERISDTQLMQRVCRGDARAFELVVGAHWDGLVAYAHALTRDRDGAKDAVQETFARLWQRRAEWRAQGSVRAYLYRAVRNRVIDTIRQRRVWGRWADRLRNELPLRPRTPAEALQENELSQAIEQAIAQLPPRRREVFVLAHFENLSYQEIADVMGLAVQSVANHMSLALRDLRRSLGPRFR